MLLELELLPALQRCIMPVLDDPAVFTGSAAEVAAVYGVVEL